MDNWGLPAISDYVTGTTVSYGELARRIAMTHLLYEEIGVKRGDKIALMGRNSIEWITTFLATITYGAVIVPVLQEFNPQDAHHIINHSDAVLLIINTSIAENFEAEKMPRLKGILARRRQRAGREARQPRQARPCGGGSASEVRTPPCLGLRSARRGISTDA